MAESVQLTLAVPGPLNWAVSAASLEATGATRPQPEIKGKTWRTGSKLEPLYRQGSLIILSLLEIFLELVYRVMCERQERCHLPLSKLGPKELNKCAYPF